ncbi:MAG: class I SAM-dependent methyltransferase [Gammaproteobacteria bacterium]|nr:class I SAM-dependent methyltransferase [Gammaproteobacteria bacterium]MDE0443527.1 class I SAM-dependent methyltransferase [Gammaproteobacteria bacterium]
MSKENDQGTLNEEFERLRVISGRIARDPGGVGMDVENLPDFFNNVAHLWDAKFAEGCAPLHRATATRVPRTRERVRILDVGCGTGLELEYILERAPNARITAMEPGPADARRARAEVRPSDAADRVAGGILGGLAGGP